MISELFSAASGIVGNLFARDNQNDSQEFSAEQYAKRYQTTVKDMQAAGLSPVLAYSQGPGSSPTSSAAGASMPDVGAVRNQRMLASAQAANLEADTANKEAQGRLFEAQAAAQLASAGASEAQTQLTRETVAKTRQEVSNLQTDNERNRAVIDNLRVEYQNLVKQGYNLTEIGNQLRATIAKIQSEIPQINQETLYKYALTQLSQLDIDAAKSLGNLGREAGQAKPLVDIITTLLKARK